MAGAREVTAQSVLDSWLELASELSQYRPSPDPQWLLDLEAQADRLQHRNRSLGITPHLTLIEGGEA